VILGKIRQLSAYFSEWMIIRQVYATDFPEWMIIRQVYATDFPEWMVGIRQPFEVFGESLRRLGRLSIFAWHAPRSAQ
jgi:hypothetical protein